MLPLSNEDRRALLSIARKAILKAVASERPGEFDCFPESRVNAAPLGMLAEHRGAFVTLHLRHRLRGCMGRVEPSDSLAETVAHSAVSAALHDPRFAPVKGSEASELEIEISVLSPLHPIGADAIEVGKHGLLVIQGGKRGLLLPQVAAERHWAAGRFLEETCSKAGIAPDDWGDPKTQLFGFTVEVFSESDFPAGYSITA